MLVLVDLENHDHLQREDPALAERFAADTLRLKYLLTRLGNTTCLILPFTDIAQVVTFNPEAVFVSGHYTNYPHYSAESVEPLLCYFRTCPFPTLGFCGALHRMVEAHGGIFAPIGDEQSPSTPRPGESLNGPGESGFEELELLEEHPLLTNLNGRPRVYQLHSWEVKEAPGFTVLAKSSQCQIQAVVHQSLPLYGVQFHPEKSETDYPDGHQILKNFLQLARTGPVQE